MMRDKKKAVKAEKQNVQKLVDVNSTILISQILIDFINLKDKGCQTR